MIYRCDSCKFLFRRFSGVNACPDCGSMKIRYATPEEREEFKRYEEEFGPAEQPVRRAG